MRFFDYFWLIVYCVCIIFIGVGYVMRVFVNADYLLCVGIIVVVF